MDSLFKTDSYGQFEKTISETLNKLYCTEKVSSDNLVHETTAAAKQEIIELLYSNNFNIDNIIQALTEKSYDHRKVDYFRKLLNARRTELLYATLAHHNSKHGETVTDFDWNLKLVLGTSELNELKYPMVQLILSTLDGNGQPNRLAYDINVDMLIKTIQVLETINEI